MEKFKKIVLWALAVAFLAAGLGWLISGSAASALYILAALITVPIHALQDFLRRWRLKGAAKVVLVVILLAVGGALVPKEDAAPETTVHAEESANGAGSVPDGGEGAETPPETADAENASEGEGADAETPSEAVADPEPEPVGEPEPEAAPVEETPLVGKDIADARIIFAGSVRNDTTGRWRLARTSEPVQMQEYAVSYYNEYFERDDEVHFVINYTNNTTSVISYYTGILEVDVYSHVDGEEHDAKILPAGERLAQYWVYKDTGEIEKL